MLIIIVITSKKPQKITKFFFLFHIYIIFLQFSNKLVNYINISKAISSNFESFAPPTNFLRMRQFAQYNMIYYRVRKAPINHLAINYRKSEDV